MLAKLKETKYPTRTTVAQIYILKVILEEME